MEENVGEADQIIRIAAGALTGATAITILTGHIDLPEVYSPVLGVISIILLATGATSKCGLYQQLGINTKN